MQFVSWEWRPAVMVSASRAFAVLAPGEGWTEVNPAEVAENGALVGSWAELVSRFGPLPPLPQPG